MVPGDLTVACDQVVPFGHDMAFQARRRTLPASDRWVLCVATTRPRITLTAVTPAALDTAIDDRGTLQLVFPAEVLVVDLRIDSGDLGESEWQFWVDDARASTFGDPPA
jgi:hypothetical protein